MLFNILRSKNRGNNKPNAFKISNFGSKYIKNVGFLSVKSYQNLLEIIVQFEQRVEQK